MEETRHAVDASDFENTIMPRSIAAAERMWTQPELLDIERATIRFPYARCEFNRRGVQAAPAFTEGRGTPVGPGSCMRQWFVCLNTFSFMDFERLGLCEQLIRAIEIEQWECESRRVVKCRHPTDCQEEAIPLILGGGDVLLVALWIV